MKSFRLSISLIAIMGGTSQAYIYELKVLRKWEPKLQDYSYFIGLSDFHDKTHPVNGQQQQEIQHLLAQCNKRTTKIVLEDLSSAGSNGRFSCGRFLVNSRGGILGGLATTCRNQGFEVKNIEYRFCRVCALSPVLNNLHQCPHSFPSVHMTPVASLAQEVDAVMDEVQSYQDGEIDVCYQECIHQIKPQLQNLKDQHGTTVSVADYVTSNTSDHDRLEFLKQLLTFDSTLLDLKMVHEVLNPGNKTRVIAISGGAHIGRAADLLINKGGFEQVYATDVQFHKEYDLTKCVGSTVIDGSYCHRPEPIDLSVMTQYL